MLINTANSQEILATYMYVEMLKVPYRDTLQYTVEYHNINTDFHVVAYVEENENNNNISMNLIIRGCGMESFEYVNANLFFDDSAVVEWVTKCLIAYERKHIEEIKKNWYE